MSKNRRKNPKPFAPARGEIYTNAGGGRYLCESGGSHEFAWMTNIASGWSFTAKGIVQYDDGTIEWDYSTDGAFLPLDGERKRMIEQAEGTADRKDLNQAINRAVFKHTQQSIMNALLCCLI